MIAGPYRDQACIALVTQAIDEGLAVNLGPVSAASKQDFFDGIDVFLFPSRYRNETEPLVVLEAMAQGVPVVASALGCIPEMLPHGFAFALSGNQAADAEMMADAIEQTVARYEVASRAMLEAFDKRRASSIGEQAALKALLATG